MIDRVNSLFTNADKLFSSPLSKADNSDHMDILKKSFDDVLSRLVKAPGMPEGVYVSNAQPPQTLTGLNITPKEI